MKRILAIITATLLAALVLAGCAAPAQQTEPSPSAAQEETPAPTEAASAPTEAASAPTEASADPGKLIIISVAENMQEGQSSIYTLANSDTQQEISFTYSDSGPINEGNDDVHVSNFEWNDNAWDQAVLAIDECHVLQWDDAYGDADGEQADTWRVELTYDNNGAITNIVKQGAGEKPEEWADLQQAMKGAYRRLVEIE